MAGDGSVSQPVKQDCNSVMMVRRCDLTLCLGVKAQPTPLRDAALQSKKFDLPRKNAEECFVVNPIELNGKKGARVFVLLICFEMLRQCDTCSVNTIHRSDALL
mmetsp:Transcript_22064/g.46457  ORF Transcript_22064/g.46457 Transcript_22064/m.46457 type:complete len:104 (-) Transcript_22064:290-601(-)